MGVMRVSTTVSRANLDRPLTDRQRMKIFAAARELQMDNEQLHDLVMRVAGQESIASLTRQDAASVIDALVRCGASGAGARRTRGTSSPASAADGPNVIRLASTPQMRMIAELGVGLGLQPDSPFYIGLVRKALGRGRSRILTSDDAVCVIEALKSVRARQGKAGGPGSEYGSGDGSA